MQNKIVLFGATGYTGHLVAESLVKRNLKPFLAGRSQEKLDALSERLGGLPTHTADLDDPDSVAALLAPGDVLITTVGPFTLYGDTAIRAAIQKRAHYIDSTGEPGFIRRVFDTYGPKAREAQVALITAGGYDYIPGNLAAAAALDKSGAGAVRVDVGYYATGRFKISQGTQASTRIAMADPGKMWRSGRLVVRYNGTKLRPFTVGGVEKPGISISSTEHYSLPRIYSQLRNINVYLGWFGRRSALMQKGAILQSLMMKLPGARMLFRAAVTRGIKSQGKGPDARTRTSSGSIIIAETFDADDLMIDRVELSGANGYTFTADILAWMGDMAVNGRLKGVGALGPVEAFGLAALTDGCLQSGLAFNPDLS